MSESEADAQVQSCPACGARVETSTAEPLARVPCPECGEKFRVDRAFDNFVLVETLGVGGMGSVYKARDTALDRFVALKLLRRDAEAGHTAQLQQEARVTASINHPHVVKVFSFGSDHGQFYLVMELVDHGSLDDSIEQRKQLPEEEVLQTAIQVAKGLQAAHAKGLIHRDVKPANILFADSTTAKIVDFGLAGAAEPKTEGAIWGTPYYVAPERLDNEPEDFRSDIYSLGGTLYHALAGRPPIQEETNSARKLRELKNQPVKLRAVTPGVSRETSRIIDRMLAPDPNARFTSYQELVEQLESAAQKLAQAGKIKRRRVIIICAAALVAVLTVLGVLFLPDTLSKQKAALKNASAIDAALQQRYEEARHQLIAGKYGEALTTFDKLAAEVTVPQPMLDWIRLHAGLAALLNQQGDKAREYFRAEEKSGAYSAAHGDRSLDEFFTETSKMLGTSESIPASASVRGEDGAQTFGKLLFAFRDFDGSDFVNASALLEQFVGAQPRSPYAWVADYKPLAQKYLDDLHTYNSWKNESKASDNAAELKTALANLRSVETRFQTRGRLTEKVKFEASQLASRSSAKEKAEKEALEEGRRKLFEKEKPAWASALSAYRSQIARYDFGSARDAVDHAPVSEPSLLTEKENSKKKAQWLIEWKKRLIDDINRSPYRGRVVDRTGTEYVAMTGASDKSFTVETSYGPGKLDWLKFDPQMLLTISKSFVRPGASDAAERQWLCAIFAAETGMPDEARRLGEAAAVAKTDYRALLPPSR